ncbi:MAG: MBL fold metallo-hydrolase [Thermonemataceae bacterium]|nr:MBL fold metallo-hydrolase [Thermonemataceae bacterium]
MKLTFWGAARQITGSMYLLELDDDYRILVDCGLDMEKERLKKRENDTTTNRLGAIFPFEASMINVVILTHAHIDHSGNLPNLIREGFEGQIICTAATQSLTKLLLHDSAMLHQRRLKKIKDKSFNIKAHTSKNKENMAEWYLPKHVEDTEEHFFALQFNRRFQIKKGLWLTLIPTGHLLGAANVFLEVEENKKIKKILFSGDLGRKNYPLLPDPQQPPQADYLLCETTYGNRKHKTQGSPEEEVFQIIQEACVKIPGRLIIPAFSVGRTQALLYTLHKLSVQGKLPPIKIFSDSPLAHQSTRIYEHYVGILNEEAQDFFKTHKNLFDFENLIYVEDLKTSKLVANHAEPCIIISSSGMIQGGRIEHHVKTNIQNPYATILMIGFAAEGTLGHQLLQGEKTLEIGEKKLPILANIRYIDIFSGHGDQDDLLNFVKQQNTNLLKQIFLIHGEEIAMQDFKNLLAEHRYEQVCIPQKSETFEL